ncbi:MAG TPA: trehalose-6-phosphate synthase [Vicinamibacterales bacterium]|nr:trehalose-6-phosphate synthase [Vicinamibacterales bacterium]
MTSAEMVAALGDRLKHTQLVVVANREPYIHLRQMREPSGFWDWLRGLRESQEVITWIRPASGLVTALDPVMRASGGTWVAHGSGNADRESSDAHGRVRVPPDRPSYTLRRVWLSEEEERGYYYGLSNGAIWPLCHIAYSRPEFNESDWEAYSQVNRRFAETVLEEIGDKPAIVFIQDYHFALLPRFIKDARPDVIVCQFWHIPWPNPEVFRVCPWAEQMLHGLLGNDLLSFHIQYHCNNFLSTVERTLEARVDYERFAVVRGGHPTIVKAFPISIDPDLWSAGKSVDRALEAREIRRSIGVGDQRMIFGIDRLDYTKGIPDRIRAFERMLKRHPEWREKVVFVQIGAPSRDQLPRYKALSQEVDDAVASVNDTYGTMSWRPVVYVREHRDPADIAAMYRAADVCVVSSLHDGMNLVAKEFIAARTDLRGVLVLSRFTGAARELQEAVLVNPFAVDEFADALNTALAMSPEQQTRRMRVLHARVRNETVYDWAAGILRAACGMAEAV